MRRRATLDCSRFPLLGLLLSLGCWVQARQKPSKDPAKTQHLGKWQGGLVWRAHSMLGGLWGSRDKLQAASAGDCLACGAKNDSRFTRRTKTTRREHRGAFHSPAAAAHRHRTKVNHSTQAWAHLGQNCLWCRSRDEIATCHLAHTCTYFRTGIAPQNQHGEHNA